MSQEPFLLLMSSLHFIALLFKHFNDVLRDVEENREKHDDIEEKAKTSLFCLYIVNLGIISGFFR